MSALLVISGLALLTVPGASFLPSSKLDPSEWARAVAVALRAGQATVRLGLFLGAAPTVLAATGLENAAEACHRMFGPIAPGGAVAGWLSAAALLGLSVQGRRARRQHRAGIARLRVEPWLGVHEQVDDVEVVTLPTDQPVAYAVPGPIHQIVLSDALRDSLSAPELEAVIAHERSHLRHRHDRLLAIGATTDACFGRIRPIRRSVVGLQLALERWADEDAATSVSARQAIREALLKTTASMLGPALAFTTACTVLDRLVALEADPPAPGRTTRLAAFVPLAAASTSVVAVLGLWTSYTHHGVLGILGFCPG